MTSSLHNSQSVSETTNGRYYIYGFVALLALGVLKTVYQNLASPLRNVPGPFLARFTRLWEVYAVCKHENAILNIALHEKYGKTTANYLIFNASRAMMNGNAD